MIGPRICDRRWSSPGGKKKQREQDEEAVLLEERADLVFGPPVQEREQDLRAVERRDRDQVEDHQEQVDLDEQVEDLQTSIGSWTASSGLAIR